MAMYVWLCMATYDYICMLCMAMLEWLCWNGYVWLCMATYDYICMLCMNSYGHYCLSPTTYQNISKKKENNLAREFEGR